VPEYSLGSKFMKPWRNTLELDSGIIEAHKSSSMPLPKRSLEEKLSSYARALSKGAVKKRRQLRALRASAGGLALTGAGWLGWITLVRMVGSWELKMRYSVQHPATLRAGPSLDSSWVNEVLAGDEVLLLDFGVACGAVSSSQAKLRALVVAGDKLGWISPETDNGEHLLMEVNLMSRKVVDIHQHALQQNGAGLRKSYQPGRSSPWKEGATYRMLEPSPIRSGPDVHSSNVGEVSAGCLVHVQEIKDVIIE
ncbi:unnamed protein product, partial [Cladocopium goreaui]